MFSLQVIGHYQFGDIELVVILLAQYIVIYLVHLVINQDSFGLKVVMVQVWLGIGQTLAHMQL